jgi:Arc/MetJ-type ribon-helix-helix transcriptional regulator
MPLEQTRITVRLTPEQDTWLATQVKPFATKSDAIRDLIDTARQGLTSVARVPAYCVGAGTQEGFTVPSVQDLQTQQVRQPAACEGQHVSPAPQGIAQPLEPKKKPRRASTKKHDPFESKLLPVNSVPSELKGCEELLREFWQQKKNRNESIFNRVCKQLLQWTPDDRLNALAASCNAGWQDVYEPKTSSKGVAVPEAKHPAYRVFTAENGFGDEPATNPVLKDLF